MEFSHNAIVPAIGLFPLQSSWTAAQNRNSAFEIVSHGRPLRIIVDTETVTSSLPVELLLEFGVRASVELLTTTPVEGLFQLRLGGRNAELDYFEADYERQDGRFMARIYGASNWDRHTREEVEEHGGDEADVLSAFVLLRAAEVLDADALVSARPEVLGPRWNGMRRKAALVAPDQALAVLGLYLRSCGDYTWIHDRPNSVEYIPPHRYYLVGTRHLLPASWRWAHATSEHFGATGNSAPVALAQGTLDRFARVLRIRDLLLAEYLREPSSDTAFEVRRHFDALLLTLSGSFDAGARVAHYAYGFDPGQIYGSSWRSASWLAKLDAVAPKLAGLCADGGWTRDLLRLVAELRNTIHGEPLADSGFVDMGGPTLISLGVSNPVLVPPDVITRIEPLLARLGGAEAWGVQLGQPTHINAGVFCEQALPRAAAALNELLAATDVERLGGVDADGLAQGPPPFVRVHAEDARERWLAMLGISTTD